MAFMTFSKKGISAKEMQRQLGHKYYEPIWLMMHKLRQAMGQRDDLYNLKDIIEFDEAYISVATEPKTTVKRGKGSQKKSNVGGMPESVTLEEPESGKQSKSVRYFK